MDRGVAWIVLAAVAGLCGCQAPIVAPEEVPRDRSEVSFFAPLGLHAQSEWETTGEEGGPFQSRSTHARSDLGLGPWDSLASTRVEPSRRDVRLLTLPLIGASLFRARVREDEASVELGPRPLSVLSFRKNLDSRRLTLGPFGVILDIDTGPDRMAWSLTPLLVYERRGSFRRVRLFFVDIYRREPMP